MGTSIIQTPKIWAPLLSYYYKNLIKMWQVLYYSHISLNKNSFCITCQSMIARNFMHKKWNEYILPLIPGESEMWAISKLQAPSGLKLPR